jgi:hypothetical protein
LLWRAAFPHASVIGRWIEAGGDAFRVRQVKSKLSFLTAGLLLGVGIGLALPHVESSLRPMLLDGPQSSLPRLEKPYERLFAAEEVVETNITRALTIDADHDVKPGALSVEATGNMERARQLGGVKARSCGGLREWQMHLSPAS